MKDFCCWNEEKDKPYEMQTIGIGQSMCLGCYRKVRE
jgi:hypothetical protein